MSEYIGNTNSLMPSHVDLIHLLHSHGPHLEVDQHTLPPRDLRTTLIKVPNRGIISWFTEDDPDRTKLRLSQVYVSPNHQVVGQAAVTDAQIRSDVVVHPRTVGLAFVTLNSTVSADEGPLKDSQLVRMGLTPEYKQLLERQGVIPYGLNNYVNIAYTPNGIHTTIDTPDYQGDPYHVPEGVLRRICADHAVTFSFTDTPGHIDASVGGTAVQLEKVQGSVLTRERIWQSATGVSEHPLIYRFQPLQF